MILPRVLPGCSLVVAYQWRAGDSRLLREVDAFEWWPLSPGLIPRTDGRRGSWIVILDDWKQYPEPTHEQLEIGEIRSVPSRGGEQYYNRSRRMNHLRLPL